MATPSGASNASFDVRDQVVIVTGASAGLGSWLAAGLAHAGARVVATARRGDRLAALVATLPDAVAVVADLTSDADRARIVAEAVAAYGRVDGLVNNAGALHALPALQETSESLRALFELDLVAPLDLARRCVQVMRANGGGRIVNVTSISAIVTTGKTVPSVGYCAAKAGLAHATREQAVQWGRYGIRVNAVAPGLFPTEMTGDVDRPPDFFSERLVLDRTGRDSEILGVVQFLLSEASAYVTGQQIAVDGGRTIT